MTAAKTKPPSARKKPTAEPLRLVVDNLSAEDKELLSYFHMVAHEVRAAVLDIVRHASVHRPLIESKREPTAPAGVRLVADAGARERP